MEPYILPFFSIYVLFMDPFYYLIQFIEIICCRLNGCWLCCDWYWCYALFSRSLCCMLNASLYISLTQLLQASSYEHQWVVILYCCSVSHSKLKSKSELKTRPVFLKLSQFSMSFEVKKCDAWWFDKKYFDWNN